MDFEKLTILIVDDNLYQRRLVSVILRECGVKTLLQAGNGLDALVELNSYGNKIDLIICDLEMPKLKGIDFIRMLRDSDTPDIPVLVITGHSDNANMAGAIEAGINGFLVKPVKPGPLISRIRTAVNSGLMSFSLDS